MVYRNLLGNKNNILLGIVESEDNYFIRFKTAKRKYSINKELVLSLVETDEEFLGEKNE